MNMFWTGVLVAMVVSAFVPGWVKGIIFVVAVFLSGVLVRLHAHTPHHLTFVVPEWLIALAGVSFGVFAWHYARLRGLQQLGSAELRTRWGNVRRVSKWGW
jgi:hypothetical protein